MVSDFPALRVEGLIIIVFLTDLFGRDHGRFMFDRFNLILRCLTFCLSHLPEVDSPLGGKYPRCHSSSLFRFVFPFFSATDSGAF